MAILTVTTSADVTDANDGVMSLREAIAAANQLAGADTIQFHATLDGQTIFLQDGALELTDELTIDGDVDGDDVADITISGDKTGDGTSGDDSQVFTVDGGTNVLDALKITGGYTDTRGGGVDHTGGTLTIRNSVIAENYAMQAGGGIYSIGFGILNISNSTITMNAAAQGGGASFGATSAYIHSSTFELNQALDIGGALYLAAVGNAEIINSTIANNTTGAGRGGGIHNRGELVVNHSTITGNYGATGSGMYTSNTGDTLLLNSLVIANGAGPNVEKHVDGTFTSFASITAGAAANYFQSVETNIFGIETGQLADNGGPVSTIAILAGSAAHNGGISALNDPSTQHDSRGENFDRVSGANVDVGAFEIQETTSEPVTITVTTLNDIVADDGEMSLREAINLAEDLGGDDIIEFDASLSGGQINLAGAAKLVISSNLTINGDVNGDSAADITISGGGASRIFDVDSGVTAQLASLNLTGGHSAGSGGAISNSGTLTIRNSSIFGNEATTNGGGIRNESTLSVVNSTIANNISGNYGGGIYAVYAVSTTILNSTLAGNSAASNGGGLSNGFGAGATYIHNSTITGNTAGTGDGGGIEQHQGTVTVSNSIVAGNNGTETFGTVNEAGNNLISDDASGIFKTGILADNGGVVQTIAIQNGGLAHDAGDFSVLPADVFDTDNDADTGEDLATDGRGPGFSRSDGSAVDIGAYEIQNLILNGNNRNNTLTGGDGDDLLFGNNGKDRLLGGDGEDLLRGGGKRDVMTGGEMADYFDFNKISEISRKNGKQADKITDFSKVEADIIDLRTIDAKSGSGNQAFKFIGKQDFHGKKGELHYFKKGNKTFVEGDTNGDGIADFKLELTGKINLTADDFFL